VMPAALLTLEGVVDCRRKEGRGLTPSGRKDVKSHRVGRATLDDGVITTAYRAVAAVTCVQCGAMIAPGSLFSRRTRHASAGAMGASPTTEPVCVVCRPLRLDDAAGDASAATDEPPTDPRT